MIKDVIIFCWTANLARSGTVLSVLNNSLTIDNEHPFILSNEQELHRFVKILAHFILVIKKKEKNVTWSYMLGWNLIVQVKRVLRRTVGGVGVYELILKISNPASVSKCNYNSYEKMTVVLILCCMQMNWKRSDNSEICQKNLS